jgi:NADH-quinone oxidoreductase subunit M
VTGVIFGAAYLLWLYQRTMLGEATNPKNKGLPDLSWREWVVFVPLMAWAVAIGVYPKPYFDVLEKPVAQIVQRVNATRPAPPVATAPASTIQETRPEAQVR